MSVYKNKNRLESNGSQSEVPTVTFKNFSCTVGGYQAYILTKEKVLFRNHYAAKFEFIRKFLNDHDHECKSITDLGSSNGLVSFTANTLDYSTIYALDHDRECIALTRAISAYLNIECVQASEYSFGDDHCTTDIVVMGALIHWVYSCTSTYGNFDAIIEYVRKLTNKYLIIEWVDPEDSAIKSFRHISYNAEVIKEPYTEENFQKSLQKHFSESYSAFDVTHTRRLYICKV